MGSKLGVSSQKYPAGGSEQRSIKGYLANGYLCGAPDQMYQVLGYQPHAYHGGYQAKGHKTGVYPAGATKPKKSSWMYQAKSTKVVVQNKGLPSKLISSTGYLGNAYQPGVPSQMNITVGMEQKSTKQLNSRGMYTNHREMGTKLRVPSHEY